MPILIELNDDHSEKLRYDRPDYPVYVRRGLLSSYPNYTAPNHWHNELELIAVLSGEMNYNVNGEIIPLTAGHGILVNAGQMHYGFSDAKRQCDFICVLLHPMLLCSTLSYERDFVLPFLRGCGAAWLSLSPEQPWQAEVYDRVVSIYKNRKRKTAPLRFLSEFSAIWALLLENVPLEEAVETRQSRDLTIAKNMVGFLQKHYAEKVSLADIAASGAVGQSKCCKLFARYFSQTPTAYLNQYRLNKSLELLRDTDMSIIEIALTVGFSSASYYAETFRKWVGMSPTEWRKGMGRREE